MNSKLPRIKADSPITINVIFELSSNNSLSFSERLKIFAVSVFPVKGISYAAKIV